MINHHLLHLHHVRDLPVHLPVYDDAFVLIGAFGLIAVGWLLTHGVGVLYAEPITQFRELLRNASRELS